MPRTLAALATLTACLLLAAPAQAYIDNETYAVDGEAQMDAQDLVTAADPAFGDATTAAPTPPAEYVTPWKLRRAVAIARTIWGEPAICGGAPVRFEWDWVPDDSLLGYAVAFPGACSIVINDKLKGWRKMDWAELAWLVSHEWGHLMSWRGSKICLLPGRTLGNPNSLWFDHSKRPKSLMYPMQHWDARFARFGRPYLERHGLDF